MSKLFIYRGLPGSGKSTKAYQYIKEELKKGNTKVINVDRDMFRMSAGLPLSPGVYEPTVSFMRDALINRALIKGYDVIESSTNLKASYVKDLAKIAYKANSEVEVIDVSTSLQECIDRDNKREGVKYVGETVIRDMYKKYFNNGFPENPLTKFELHEPTQYKPDWSLPKAYICDIDGTVAKNVSRSPYDYTKVFEDEPHQDVITFVKNLNNPECHILFVSGRDHTCRSDTRAWLRKHFGNMPYKLFMRDAEDKDVNGNKLADYIVKSKIFDELQQKYNIIGWIDDRKQVIDYMRARGVRVYDVAGNEF